MFKGIKLWLLHFKLDLLSNELHEQWCDLEDAVSEEFDSEEEREKEAKRIELEIDRVIEEMRRTADKIRRCSI